MTRKFDVIGYQDWQQSGSNGNTASRLSVDITSEFDSSIRLIASTKLHDYEDVGELIDENEITFSDPTRWRVNQIDQLDRTGIRNFKSIPYWIFTDYWRKPINIFESALTPMGGGIYRFMKPSYFGNCWNRRITCWLNWTEVNLIVEFLREHSPELYLFTDADSIFPDHQIEFAYLGDWGVRG